MSIKAIAAEVSKYPEFRHVTLEQCPEWVNVVLVGGDAIGKGAMDRLTEIARKHDYVAFAHHLTVWHSEENFEQYGKLGSSDVSGVEKPRKIVNLADWKESQR